MFWSLAILIGVQCYLTVVWNCDFLMIYKVEHVFVCLFTISISSLAKCLFRSLPFLNGLFFKSSLGNSLVVQWLGLGALTAQRDQVQSLVGVLRSCTLCGTAKKRKKRKELSVQLTSNVLSLVFKNAVSICKTVQFWQRKGERERNMHNYSTNLSFYSILLHQKYCPELLIDSTRHKAEIMAH